jgi:hypothetical protein
MDYTLLIYEDTVVHCTKTVVQQVQWLLAGEILFTLADVLVNSNTISLVWQNLYCLCLLRL